MKNQMLFIILLVGTIFSTNVFAQNTTVWQAPAMTFVPTSTTMEQSKYVTTAGVVKFKPGKTGAITFTKAITRPLKSGNYILSAWVKAQTKQPRGMAMGQFRDQLIYMTTIQLRKRNNMTGRVETILDTYLGSREYGPGNFKIFSATGDFGEKLVRTDFDFSKFTYWISISIRREKSTSHEVSIGGVELSLKK